MTKNRIAPHWDFSSVSGGLEDPPIRQSRAESRPQPGAATRRHFLMCAVRETIVGTEQ
jgi:hypothetical protein